MSKKNRKKSWFKLFFLHRYAGLYAAFFAVLLSVTGILLNHTEELGLKKQNISTSWLMGLYGIDVPKVGRSFFLPTHTSIDKENLWAVEFGGDVYLNEKKSDCKAALTGAVRAEDLFIISGQRSVCLLTSQAELVDLLSLELPFELGSVIKRLGRDKDKKIVVETSVGLFGLNDDYTEVVFRGASTDESRVKIEWIHAKLAPPTVIRSLEITHTGYGLPLERIILDLHSGRIFALAGVYFMDFIALLIIFLSLSGVILWMKRKMKKSQKKATFNNS